MTGANTLMNTTLPTIIGMHVVSKSTETMFGKNGKRRAGSRRPVQPKSRVGSRKVHTGSRGGKYIMKKGRRIYI